MKKKNKVLTLLLVLLIIAIIYLIIFLLVDKDKYNWNDIILKDYMVEPSSKSGIITYNNEFKLILQVNSTSKSKYRKYINNMIDFGYGIKVEDNDINYKSYNEYNYEFKVEYKNRKMFIELTAPLLENISDEFKNQLPDLPTIGTKLIDTSNEQVFAISNIDKTKYDNYVDQCIKKGFTVNTKKSDKTFSAQNSEKYNVKVDLLDNNIMKIDITLPNYDINIKVNYFSSEDTSNPKIKFRIDGNLNTELSVKETKDININLNKGTHFFEFASANDNNIMYQESITFPNTSEIKFNLKLLKDKIENDIQVPKVLSIKFISPDSGTYRYKQEIVTRVEFDENVTGTAPELKLNIGTTEVNCSVKEIKDNYIDYIYTVGKTEFGQVEVSKISGNNLTDLAGNQVELSNLKNTGNKLIIQEREKDKGGIYEKSYKVSNGRSVDYYIYYPPIDAVDTYENLPLVVQMQCCCIDTFKALKNYALLGYLRKGTIKDPKAIIVTPKAYTASPIGEFDTKYIMEFIKYIVKENKIDSKRITISGHSQGARHVLRLVKATPNYFAGVVLLSWLESGKEPHDMQKAPMPDCPTLFVFEDSKGGDYNYNIAKSLITKYPKANIKVIRTKNTVHGDVYKAFYQDNVLDWMISQKRK